MAGLPLLINDRVDIARAAGLEGLHVGQDNLSYEHAREMLGPDAIIGLTASNEEKALRAAEEGADFLGIGTVYFTSIKENTKAIIGTSAVQSILSRLAAKRFHGRTKAVCIGSINTSNAGRV